MTYFARDEWEESELNDPIIQKLFWNWNFFDKVFFFILTDSMLQRDSVDAPMILKGGNKN